MNPIGIAKVLYHRDRVEKIMRGGTPWPVKIEMDVSNVCNHNCPWCFVQEFRDDNKVNLDPLYGLPTLRTLLRNGGKAVLFSGGGEPFMNPNITDYWKLCSEYDAGIGMSTNGENIDHYLHHIRRAPFKYIRISLDGGPSSYETLHGVDCYDRVIGNIELLAGLHQFTVGVAFLLHPSNFHEIEDVVSRVKATGADYIQFRPIVHNSESLIVPGCDTKINNLRSKYADANFSILHTAARVGTDMKKIGGLCYASKLETVITATGDVAMCCQYRGAHNIGNIYQDDIQNIWGGPAHEKLFNSFDIDNCPACRMKPHNLFIRDAFVNDNYHLDFV